jgi:hypothetical protein
MTQSELNPSALSDEARRGGVHESADFDRRAVGDNDETFAVLGMLRGAGLARAVETAAELGVADLVADGPRSSDDLAEATDSHAPSLYRLLRALAAHGVFRPSVDAVYGMSLWQYFDDVDPAAGAAFDAAMTSGSNRLAPAILAAYDFSAFSTLVDVGGGHGHMLAALLHANPRLHGVLFDRPSTVAALHDNLRAPGVAERVEVVAGSFFDRVPPGADAYVLKLVLHDWDDESAGRILSRLREAVPAHGRLLVVDRVLSRTTDLPAAALVDLVMLKNHAGRERTEDEFRALLSGAGFELTHVAPAGLVCILEARTS